MVWASMGLTHAAYYLASPKKGRTLGTWRLAELRVTLYEPAL
jgi:hypothetical protein